MIIKKLVFLSIILSASLKTFSTDTNIDKTTLIKEVKKKLNDVIKHYENKYFETCILIAHAVSEDENCKFDEYVNININEEFLKIIINYLNILTQDEITELKKKFIASFEKLRDKITKKVKKNPDIILAEAVSRFPSNVKPEWKENL